MIDQNLASALYAIILPTLLPYVLTLETRAEIWQTNGKQLQSTNCARLLQIKNELHSLLMGNRTMMQYLSDIKSKVDLIATSSSPLNNEDIIYCTLNGLPSSYKAFKTSIRTNLQPLHLEDFYSLLCTGESIQNSKANQTDSAMQTTLVAHPGGYRGRTSNNNHPYHGCSNSN